MTPILRSSLPAFASARPHLTTRGMKEPEMRIIAAWIAKALEQRNDDAALDRIRGEVAELANQFPLYAWRRAPETVAR